MSLVTFIAGTKIKSSEVNSNFSLTLLKDTAGTVSVSHTWTASQVMAGLSSSAAITVSDTTDSTTALTGSITTAGGMGIAKSLFVGAAIAFATILRSTTALATPTALAATAHEAWASTVSGAAVRGFGTTNDVALMNRAGTVVLGVGPNTTAVNIPGSLVLTGATVTGAPTWSSTQTMNITGNVTGNCSGTAATVTSAAQPAITSVGTLTSLVLSGGISGVTTLSGSGAVSGFTSISMNGALSGTTTIASSGQHTSTATGLLYSRTGVTTSLVYFDVGNTTGRFNFGVEGSAGAQILAGTAAYGTALTTIGATNLYFGVNSVIAATISGTAFTIASATTAVQALTTAGNITVTNNAADVIINGSSGATSNVERLLFQRGGVNKWRLGVNQDGSNIDNFALFSDAYGTNVFLVTATTGAVAFTAGISCTTVVASSSITGSQLVLTTASGKVTPGATAFTVRNNADSADNMVLVDAGSVTFRSSCTATAFFTSSLRSLKRDISPFTGSALSIVRGTDIYGYAYKSDPSMRRVGWMADSTHHLLAGSKHDRMDMANGVGILMKAVQELADKNDRLEREMAEMRRAA